MESNIVLQVIMHEEGGLEIMVGNTENVNPLTLIGIIEQIKMNILSNVQVQEVSNNNNYDA